ncbi:MAG: RNA polymerase sigma factor [Planctomycetota bacterium]
MESQKPDEPPLESLLEKELASLRAFVDRQLGQQVRARESSADIVQSVCREALEDRGQFEYRGEAAFRHWLQRCALHKIYRKWEYHKAQKRDAAREVRAEGNDSEGGLAHLARTSRTPSRELMDKQAVERIHAAIECLPDKYRLAVTLHKLVGLSSKEIADETGQSEGAVRTQVYRGLAQLGVLLAEDGASA